MREYKTEQRRLLLDFFEKNSAGAFSAEQLMAQLPTAQISRSAVYRNLDRMVQDGLLRRQASPEGGKTLYRYADCCRHCARIHLQCEKCGRVFHFENASDEERIKSLLHKSGFHLDEQATMLPGTCRDCSPGAGGQP